MTEFVELYWKRNRGWLWPKESWGLSPMFGEEGWCRSCGVPKHAQTGSLMLQRSGLTVSGAWVPYWRYDTICMDGSLAAQVSERFDVALRPVIWPKSSPVEAFQLVIPTIGEAWYDTDELTEGAIARHGKHDREPGARCPDCHVYRWLPPGTLPRIRAHLSTEFPIAASPEWFGSGWEAYREVIVRRDLADLIAEASPRDFAVKALGA